MMTFAHINDLESFKLAVGEKDEIRHMAQPNGYTVSCYLISGPTTFDNPAAAECRGIVFDETGAVAARPLHKFFNLNEREGARPEDFNWHQLARIMDKRDGSMIHTVRVNFRHSPFSSREIREGMPVDQEHMTWGARIQDFTLKSKKSFTSDVALQAQAWMATRKNYIDFCQQITDLGCTAIFEWTSPTARIVLPYAEEMLTLLHIRDNKTGNYVKMDYLLDVAKRFEIPVVASSTVTPEQQSFFESKLAEMFNGNDPKVILKCVLELQETITDVEGWVFQFNDGQMVKVKTKWYLERHRAMTFLRERDIVGAVLNESLDDLKALLVGEGVNISEIESIEARVLAGIQHIEHQVKLAMDSIKLSRLDKKTAALTYGPKGENNMYFGLIMKAMDGKEPDVKGWYERNILPEVPLRQLNLLQSVAESD